MTVEPASYFDAYEIGVDSVEEFTKRVEQVEELGNREELEFFWRGQENADWGVHTSAHRFVATKKGVEVEQVTEQRGRLREKPH
jgi:hypothetical protein